MKAFIHKKLPYIMILLQAVLIAGILFYIVPGRYRLYDIVLYDAAESVPANPLIGYAPPAGNREDCQDTELVFLLLPFSDLEPEEGVFDFEGIEENYHLAEYRRAGKHAVLRFVCDIPGSEAHRDIPDWLYAKTGDGTDYSDASGKGYCPDYANEIFIEAHDRAIAELARWCREDSFVSYVEIGSAGQKGAWSSFARGTGESFLSETIQDHYIQQYQKAFPAESGIRLLACPGADGLPDAGNWNDVLGDPQKSAQWTGTLAYGSEEGGQRAGGEADSAPKGTEAAGGKADSAPKDTEAAGGEADSAPKGTEAGGGKDPALETASPWMLAPVGSGMTEGVGMDILLNDSLSDTLGQIRAAHLSFIGPLCPDARDQNTNGSEMILRNIGYCIYLSRLQTTVDFIGDDLVLALSFSNIGNAPLYWDWPVTMYVYDNNGICIRRQVLDISLSDLLPGRVITATGTVPYSKDLLKGYSVGISIVSPDGKNILTMAQKGVEPGREGIHKIYRYRP